MKLSNIILTTLALLMGLSVISFAFHAKENLTKIVRPPIKPWVIPQGVFTELVDSQSYKHLVVDFKMVELDPQISDYLKIEGYGQAIDFVNYRYEGDTLFIENTEIADTVHLVNIENEPNLKVIVGAQNLQSLTINRGGNIYHSLSPYGSDELNQQVFHQELWDKYALNNKRLKVVMNGGTARFLLEAGTLDLDFKLVPGGLNSVTMIGNLEELNINEPTGQLRIAAQSLKLGKLNYHESKENLTLGTITVNCNESIHATLFHNTDLFYKGAPTIKKRETGYGRVMKGSASPTYFTTSTIVPTALSF